MAEIAPQTEERRRAFLRGKTWIKYPFAEALLVRLKKLMDTPRCHRMPGLLIIGETNSGKTMTVARFEKRYSHRSDVTILVGANISTIPVVCVQTPNSSDEARFYNALLSAIGAPARPTTHAKQLQSHVIDLLRTIGCRMLIIDEVHNLLVNGPQKLRVAQAMIRYLSNELQIPIVCVGIRDALNVFVADPQLSSRFRSVVFPRWQMDEAFMTLLLSFESRFPDWVGVLTSPNISAKVLAYSEGYLGEIIDLLMLLREHIDVTGVGLSENSFEECGYVPPSMHSKMTAL